MLYSFILVKKILQQLFSHCSKYFEMFDFLLWNFAQMRKKQSPYINFLVTLNLNHSYHLPLFFFFFFKFEIKVHWRRVRSTWEGWEIFPNIQTLIKDFMYKMCCLIYHTTIQKKWGFVLLINQSICKGGWCFAPWFFVLNIYLYAKFQLSWIQNRVSALEI